MWVPWSFLHPLCCEVGPLVERYCMWESLFVDLQYISRWIGMPFETLQRERAYQYLQYVYISVKINTGPSRMKGVQSRWLAISGQLLSLRNSATLRSQQRFLWLPGWTSRDVCSLTKWKPIESFYLLSFQCLSRVNVFSWILLILCNNKNPHTSPISLCSFTCLHCRHPCLWSSTPLPSSMPVMLPLFISVLYPCIMLIPPYTKLRLFPSLWPGCAKSSCGHGKMKTEGRSQEQLWWGIWGYGPCILFRPLIFLKLNYIFFLWWTVLGASDIMLDWSDGTQLRMSSFRDMVIWYPAEIILHLPGLSNLQEAVSQKEYNSPLLVAWPWSRTRRACARILPPGLVFNAALHLFNHLLVRHNGDGSFGPTGRVVCSLNFLQSPLLLLILLRAGSLLCHRVYQPEK